MIICVGNYICSCNYNSFMQVVRLSKAEGETRAAQRVLLLSIGDVLRCFVYRCNDIFFANFVLALHAIPSTPHLPAFLGSGELERWRVIKGPSACSQSEASAINCSSSTRCRTQARYSKLYHHLHACFPKMKPSSLLSLEKQYTFYKAYHSNTINKRIHIVFVPVILVTTLTLISCLPRPAVFSDKDPAMFLTALYVAYCLILSPFLGVLFAPFVLLSYLSSQSLKAYAGEAATVPLAFTLNFTGWVAQFVGHFAFEGRAPALFDSLVQSLLAGPIVIWLDVLFMCGLLPEVKAKLLRSRVVAKAKKAVANNPE